MLTNYLQKGELQINLGITAWQCSFIWQLLVFILPKNPRTQHFSLIHQGLWEFPAISSGEFFFL